MLVAVVILFLVSWLPIKIFMTVITYSPEWLFIDDPQSNNAYIASYFICHWLAMNTSMINPIIYSFMSKSFRVCLFLSFLLFHITNSFQFDFKELVTKIYGGKQQSFVCNNVPVTRSSNPYGDYESRNSSNSYKIATPNGQISASVLMVLIEENNNKDDNQEIENEKEQQLIQTDTNC